MNVCSSRRSLRIPDLRTYYRRERVWIPDLVASHMDLEAAVSAARHDTNLSRRMLDEIDVSRSHPVSIPASQKTFGIFPFRGSFSPEELLCDISCDAAAIIRDDAF